jgi:hypothetical protein
MSAGMYGNAIILICPFIFKNLQVWHFDKETARYLDLKSILDRGGHAQLFFESAITIPQL